jgi:hypothetical protein
VFSWEISGIGLDGPAWVECHRIFPGTPAAGISVDRDGAAVDIVLDTERAVIESLVRGATSPRLSAIVLGPLMVVYVEIYLYSDGFLASQAAIWVTVCKRYTLFRHVVLTPLVSIHIVVLCRSFVYYYTYSCAYS